MWCQAGLANGNVYTYERTQAPRANCRTSFVKLHQDGLDGQDGTDGPSEQCRLLQLIVVNKDSDYIAKFRCKLYGEEPASNAVYRLSLKANRLVLTAINEGTQ